MAKRTFISFDYDNDEDLRILLFGQSKNPDSPFEIIDYSVREPFTGDWKKKVRARINQVTLVIVICGEYTDNATGVSEELRITYDLDKEYFLLNGRKEKRCVKPTAAKVSDKIYKWTWDNLEQLVAGHR